MKKKNVKIDKDIYTLTAVTADVSGAVALELIQNISPVILSFVDGNIDALNKELRESMSPEKLMRTFKELINFDILEINGDLCVDWQETFSCKPLTLFKLGIEALRFNCEDFFTSISGLLKENNTGVDLKNLILNLKNAGVAVPQTFVDLFQTGEEVNSVEVKKKKSK